MDRRDALRAIGSLGAAVLAGCTSGAGAGDGSSGGDGSGGGRSDTTESAQTLENHPAASDLADLPTLGPDPTAALGVIIAFEDPSCPTCRRFETGAFPEIKSNLVDAGEAAFVYRTYPVVYEWGKPAVQALEATYVRDADAFWALKAHYYAEQDAFTTDNVLEQTRSFLASETDLDADAVVSDAEAKEYDDRVQRNLDAGKAAGASATPTCFLFKDGQYVTKVVGAKPYSVYESALTE